MRYDTLGFPLLVRLASTAMSELPEGIAEYQAAWHEAGHPGPGEVRLRLPSYVAESMDWARSEPQARAMLYYERAQQASLRSAKMFESPAPAERLATLTYEDVLQARVVLDTPKLVTERLSTLRHVVGGAKPIEHQTQPRQGDQYERAFYPYSDVYI
jgi:hypothetical protein